MAAKKVFVDLDVQSGSNVNVQSNLSVTGTSTLRTADLRQTIFTKQVSNLSSAGLGSIDFTISPDTSVLVITGIGQGNTIKTISPSSGSFINGKILEVQNETTSFLSLNIKTIAKNPDYAFSPYTQTNNLDFVVGTSAYTNNVEAIYGYLANPSNLDGGPLTEIKPFDSIKFQFQTSNMGWVDLGKNYTIPNYLHFYVDTQTDFSYTSATSDFTIQIKNPFGNKNINFKLGALASSSTSLTYPIYPSVFEYSNVLLNESLDKISSGYFIAVLNKSALETFRASNRYIHFYIIL